MREDLIIENGVLVSYTGEEHSVTVPEGITAIGEGAFKGMAWITDVSLPEGLTEIRDNAFKGCRKLERINFPDSLTTIGDLAFHRCHSLVSVILPDSVTALGKGTFLFCDSLQTIRAFGVKRLEMQTFANNTRLREIAFSSDIDCSNFMKDVFTGCLGIKKIDLSGGFSYQSDNLISALISEPDVHPVVRAIAGSIYQSLEYEDGVLNKLNVNLRSFELPDGIKTIGKGCFFDKKGIVSISFPESTGRICTNAFGNCINLEQITFKNDSIVIDDGAFRGCSNLKNVIIGNKNYRISGISCGDDIPYIVKRISDQVMSDFYISGKILMSYNGSEERVTIPDGIEIIGESCFEGNEKLGRVIMSDTVCEVHENAFRNCVCMQSAAMSESLQKICRSAFENCRKLIRFNVPESLRETGDAAFRGCVSLEVAEFETGTLPAVRETERKYGSDDIAPYSFCDDKTVTEFVCDKPVVIGKYAFSACPELKSVVINAPGCIIEKYAFEKCPSLKKVSVLAGTIGKGAFAYCRNLEEAEISGVSVLESELFAGCSSLRKVTVSEGVSEIGRRCFDECVSLESFDFTNIRAIGERAFERCDSLREINLNGADTGYHAFADCSGLKTITTDSASSFQSGAFRGCTCADTVILDGECYPFSCFAQSMNSAGNHYPLRVQEIIGSVYSCFEVNSKYGIVKYRGDAVKVRIPDDIV